jgi:uncharacterized protein
MASVTEQLRPGDCFFVTDLHGGKDRYEKLFRLIEKKRPKGVFLGGDLLPNPLVDDDFVRRFLIPTFQKLKIKMEGRYPPIFLILGNDDCRAEEGEILRGDALGLWTYVHQRRTGFGRYSIYGCAFVPPTPFLLKDWERYDVSRFVDPGCVSPEDGRLTVPVAEDLLRNSTIQKDLMSLVGHRGLSRAVFLFHSPPYQTKLDRAALDQKKIDHVPLDVHVGSIAIRRFIEDQQPLLTLHGHVHESTRLTGSWKDTIGRTPCFNAAHDGPELSIITFSLRDLSQARRDLI